MTTLDKVKASKAKCKRHRDNWKRRALAFRGIIRRTRAKIERVKKPTKEWYGVYNIICEADKPDKEGK